MAAAASTPITTVHVEESDDGKFANRVRHGRHEFLADEPTHIGGDDLGPSPWALLLAALGGCISITLRMYAARKGWPLEHVAVDLDRYKVDAAGGGLSDRIRIDVTISGPLDAGQRARLVDIAHRCPVHRALQGGIEMPMHFADEEP